MMVIFLLKKITKNGIVKSKKGYLIYFQGDMHKEYIFSGRSPVHSIFNKEGLCNINKPKLSIVNNAKDGIDGIIRHRYYFLTYSYYIF